ncbi:hypothetical protein [Shewanella sp. MEBiC00475]|uniref:hypothetical protein n=1 Tax=Shewanella sp. MEBiC00475 TaxID=2575361 RepID=UPI0010BFC5D7|nr:hypothetical protein [Shewanella sp. MEBiC00475]
MNISGLGSTTSITDNLQKAQVRLTSDFVPLDSSSSQDTQSDTVSISDEGQKKLSTELGATMHKNASSAEIQQSEQADTRTENEKLIDKLKEQIKELQEQRRDLAGDNSPQAQDQLKMIDNKIMMLNTQLMTLLKVQKEAETSSSS